MWRRRDGQIAPGALRKSPTVSDLPRLNRRRYLITEPHAKTDSTKSDSRAASGGESSACKIRLTGPDSRRRINADKHLEQSAGTHASGPTDHRSIGPDDNRSNVDYCLTASSPNRTCASAANGPLSSFASSVQSFMDSALFPAAMYARAASACRWILASPKLASAAAR